MNYCWVDSNNPYYFAYNNDIYTKDTKKLVHYTNNGRYELKLPDWCTGMVSNLSYQEFGTLGFMGRGFTDALRWMITRKWRKVEFGPCLERVEGWFALYAENLKEIVMPPLTPPLVVDNDYGEKGLYMPNFDPQQCTLYVNPKSIELYKAHPEWSKFFIQPMTEEMLNFQKVPGDVNGDGTVNVLDVTNMISYWLGESLNVFIFENGDVNHDGTINVLDVTDVIDIILSH